MIAPLDEAGAAHRLHARVQLLPDALVGPVVDGVVGLDLQVHALQGGRAGADQREAAVVQRVDELVGGRGCLDEDPEPGEGVDALVLGADALRDGLAGRAPVSVAAGDDVAGQLLQVAAALQADLVGELTRAVADRRAVGLDPVDLDGLGLPDDPPARLDARLVEILDDLVLPVERDRPPAGELLEVDPMVAARPAQLDAVVHGALGVHAIADAGLAQELRDVVLENACADGRLDRLAAARVQHDGVDPLERQQVRQQQSRWASAQNPDLCVHPREPTTRAAGMLEHRIRFPYIDRSRQEEP